MAPGLLGGGGRARRRICERLARPGYPPGRCLRDPGDDPRRVGALRLRARADRRDRGGDLRIELAEGRRLHHRALRFGRRPLRGRGAAREGGAGSRRDPAPAARSDLRRPGRARRAGSRFCRDPSERPGRGGGGRRGRRPLHLHLHVRDDRPAEGLHDLEPQLLRHGRRRGRPGDLHRPRGHDAPVPAARPQLRSADAPLRALRRLHDRFPARSAPGRERARHGQADGLPERAAGLREDPHRRPRQVRRGDGSSSES